MVRPVYSGFVIFHFAGGTQHFRLYLPIKVMFMKTKAVKLFFQLSGSLLIVFSLGFILINFSDADYIVPQAVPFTIAGVMLVFASVFITPTNKRNICK